MSRACVLMQKKGQQVMKGLDKIMEELEKAVQSLGELEFTMEAEEAVDEKSGMVMADEGSRGWRGERGMKDGGRQ